MPIKHSTPEDFVPAAGLESFPTTVVADVIVAEAIPPDDMGYLFGDHLADDLTAGRSRRTKLIALGAGVAVLLVAGAIVWRIRAR